MTETAKQINLFDLNRDDLVAWFASIGEPRFRAEQLMKWIYHEGVTDFDVMTNLSKSLRAKLTELASCSVPKTLSHQSSTDGTKKWLVELETGNCIETVFIPEEDRGTLCISSQVGCILDCSFCATGKQGFNRNLTTAEIVSQVWIAHHALGGGKSGERRLTNIVFMGMGEPLYNFKNVMKAIDVLLDDLGFGLSKRRVTLSTSGVVPNLYDMAEQKDVALAVSLHAPNDPLRDVLVPLNQRYPIADLMEACRYYLQKQGARFRVTWEYVMIDDVNDSPELARELGRLLKSIPSKINLIPFNPFPGSNYQTSSKDKIDLFRDILIREFGIMTVTRKTRGDDIAAACGQLAGQVQDKVNRTIYNVAS
jgi:23S rRNA (adenine2503-C2)-methyltransferase